MAGGPTTHRFADAGGIPNSPLPVLIYQGVEAAGTARGCQELFARNGWLGAWVDGIYRFHHFHSTAHEVLGIVGGSAAVILGGPEGQRFDVGPGDVLVLPGGTGHFNAGSSADLVVVGAYPNGMRPDLRRGEAAERAEVLANIVAVPLPESDPVHGQSGPLTELWRPDITAGRP
ncbi:MAG TPA: cupin domain-containing protein [Miltoncostaeaceae bacterium]|nr:cupin domain-containing protein [Miltoncostaeaceae bacterium]